VRGRDGPAPGQDRCGQRRIGLPAGLEHPAGRPKRGVRRHSDHDGRPRRGADPRPPRHPRYPCDRRPSSARYAHTAAEQAPPQTLSRNSPPGTVSTGHPFQHQA
jgi:hypothetical protein